VPAGHWHWRRGVFSSSISDLPRDIVLIVIALEQTIHIVCQDPAALISGLCTDP
jgi:hypothetical protein